MAIVYVPHFVWLYPKTKTTFFLTYNAWLHMDLLFNFTCWTVFIYYINSLGWTQTWPQTASLESKFGFEQLFLFSNFSYFIWLGFIGLPDNILIQNTKARQKQYYQPCVLKALHLPTFILVWPLSFIFHWPHSQVLLVTPCATRKRCYMRNWWNMAHFS